MRVRVFIDIKAKIASVILACIVGLPAFASFFTNHALREHNERRQLAELPNILNSREAFFSDLDNYLSDHTGFMLKLIEGYRRLSFYIFCDSPMPHIKRGRDGFLFMTGSDKTAPYNITTSACISTLYTPQKSELITLWLDLIEGWKNRGYRVALVVAPEKHSIYPEKLPKSIPANLRKTCLELGSKPRIATELVKEAKTRNLTVIYPFADFIERKKQGNFYPKESFHWHGVSTNYTAKKLADSLDIALPESYPEKWEYKSQRSDISNQIGFELYFRQLIPNYEEYGTVLMDKPPDAILRYMKKNWKPAGQFVSERPVTDRTALLFGNSFTREFAVHVAPLYANLSWILTNTWTSEEATEYIDAIVDDMKPDDLIFVTHDAGLGRKSALLPPIE